MGRTMDNYRSLVQWNVQSSRPHGSMKTAHKRRSLKKLRKSKGEILEDRLILFFELGKELGDDQIKEGDKNDRLCARRVYKSFEKSYPWIPIGKDWKLRYFSRISVK